MFFLWCSLAAVSATLVYAIYRLEKRILEFHVRSESRLEDHEHRIATMEALAESHHKTILDITKMLSHRP